MSRGHEDRRRTYLSVAEVAARYGVSHDTVYRAIKLGRLPATRVATGPYRVTVDDARQWAHGTGGA